MDEKKKKGERNTLAQHIAAIDAAIDFHARKLEAARARKAALAGEKKKRAALLLDEAATIERMTQA